MNSAVNENENEKRNKNMRKKNEEINLCQSEEKKRKSFFISFLLCEQAPEQTFRRNQQVKLM